MRQHLYKYFAKPEWAEQFLDGSIYFNSLGYVSCLSAYLCSLIAVVALVWSLF